jgi:hypothetical protein
MLPLKDNAYKAEGNQQVIELLDKWIGYAKQGQLKFACVIGSRGGDDVQSDWAGAQGSEFAVCFGLDDTKRLITEDLRSRMMPNLKQDPDPSCWEYNLAQGSVGFDFHSWLVRAEAKRRELGAPGPLKVHFHVGEKGIGSALNSPGRIQMFMNVVRPMLTLMGAVESSDAANGSRLDARDHFSYKPLHAAYAKHGPDVLPKFKASEEAKDNVSKILNNLGIYRRPVVITLREEPRIPHRNSNLPEWIKFADWLKEKHLCEVVFVRDTAKAEEGIQNHFCIPEASRLLEIRMALYEIAGINFFVSNGPAVLTWFSDCNWIMVHKLDPNDPYDANTPASWEAYTGVPPGGQFPWARSQQAFVWGEDNFETLSAAFIAHCVEAPVE